MSEETLTATVTLRRPVKHGDAVYATLTFREPTVGDQLDVAKPGMSAAEVEVALLAHLASVPVEVVRKAPLVDYRQIQAVLTNFPYPAPTSSGAASSSLAAQPAGA